MATVADRLAAAARHVDEALELAGELDEDSRAQLAAIYAKIERLADAADEAGR